LIVSNDSINEATLPIKSYNPSPDYLHFLMETEEWEDFGKLVLLPELETKTEPSIKLQLIDQRT